MPARKSTMRRIALTLTVCLAAASPVFADGTSMTNILSTEESRNSYALGMYYGHNLQQQGVAVDWDFFARGFKDSQAGGAMLMSPDEMRNTLGEFQKTVQAKQQQMREQQAVKN